jgi:hypothetical protein
VRRYDFPPNAIRLLPQVSAAVAVGEGEERAAVAAVVFTAGVDVDVDFSVLQEESKRPSEDATIHEPPTLPADISTPRCGQGPECHDGNRIRIGAV